MLEILDASNRVIRRYSSRDTSMAPADLGETPSYWIRTTKVLSSAQGFHRFVWDLHYSPPAGTSAQPGQYPISAVPFDTPREPRGPLAIAGSYRVRLTVGDKTQKQMLTLKMDPRVKTPPEVLARQHALAVALWDDIARDSATASQIRDLRAKVGEARGRTDASLAQTLSTYDGQLGMLAGQGGGGRRGGGGGGAGGAPAGGRGGRGAVTQPSIASTNAELLSALSLLDEADTELTPQGMATVLDAKRTADAVNARWTILRTTELAGVNAKLRAAGLPVLDVAR
jgi:hypothetical protein